MAIYQITNPALLGQLYAGLQRHLTNPADPVRLAAALCAELPALDAAEAADAAQRIVQGVQHGRQLLHRPAFTTAQSMEQLLPVLTDEITSAERKGFYLILYEAYRQSDREVCTAAGTAPPDHTLVPGMDEEGLCRLAARQLELHAADLFTGQRDDTSLSAAEPELMAAAMFAAHKKGALNSPLAQDASLLGFACGAAAELRSIDQEEAARMVHLLLAALAAVAVIYMVNPAAGELSASLLQLLENGTLHSAVCNLLKPIAASLEHLLPAAIGTVTMVDIRKGLDVFYNDVSDRYPPIIPWRPPLKLDQDHKPDIWTDTFR